MLPLNHFCSSLLTGETIVSANVNWQDEACIDIHVRGFWEQYQGAFFNVRVFHLNAPSYCNSNIPSIYWHHEQEKKREYSYHVWKVEKASFTHLVFVTTGV